MINDYYINGNTYSKECIASVSWPDYINFALGHMPQRLYKYYPNTIDSKTTRNFSIEALANNTVYLQSPIKFDDPYDCTLCLDEK